MNATEEANAQKLVNAVDRILADSGSLIATGQEMLRRAAAAGGTEAEIRQRAIKATIAHYSTRTAVSGGASALTGILPGVGTAVAMVGGAFADMGFLLKFEIEMALVLTHLHGYDIRKDAERKRAFLLASISTHDAQAGGNFLVDVMKAEQVALWNYAPRQLSKVLLTVVARLLLQQARRGLLRGLPLIGVGVGAAVNKTLTARVGERCAAELARRVDTHPPATADEDVVEAHVRE